MNVHRIFQVVSPWFRTKRMDAFVTLFSPAPTVEVLDIGGRPGIWKLIPNHHRPHLTLLNTQRNPPDPDLDASEIVGDGCHLPFKDGSFDIVFSNSTIEHVGDHQRQQQFAQEVRRVGRSYYVQTPNKWFPIEPHYMTPLIHFVPPWLRARLLRRGTVWGWIANPSAERCRASVDEIRLLSENDLRRMFPDARIERERLFGLTKSLIAVRTEH